MQPRDQVSWRKQPVLEYRWRCGRRKGRWRPSHVAAADAAVSAGLAIREGSQLYLGPLVEIEERSVE